MSLPIRSDKTHSASEARKRTSRLIYELCLFPMLGALMLVSKIALEWAPNIHMLGMFTMVFTVVYRSKALIPIYLYAAAIFLIYGFAPWCVIHFYVWTVLWAITMLIPRRLPKRVLAVLYPTVCALHGLSYGFLCAFTQVPLYYDSFAPEMIFAYVSSGLYFDLLHGIGNIGFGLLILPLSSLLLKLDKRFGRRRRTDT